MPSAMLSSSSTCFHSKENPNSFVNMVSTSVANIFSVLRENDVKALYVEFNIPKDIAWRVPNKDDRAFSPPVGHMTV
ncbi:hypothetical protein Nepgr_006538, partial [Nepenthes gracilis]